MNEEDIARAMVDPWRNVNVASLRVAIAHLMNTDKPTTVTIRKEQGSDGRWMFSVDIQSDK